MNLCRNQCRLAVAVFLFSFLSYAYFYQGGGSNQNTRLDLVMSLITEHSFQINRYHNNTNDKAKLGENYYCDKAPGASFAALPLAALVSHLYPLNSPQHRNLTLYAITLATSALPTALTTAALLLVALSCGLSPRLAVTVAIGYSVASLAFPYATLFYGHQLAASLLFLSFTLVFLVRHRGAGDLSEKARQKMYFAAGVMLGFSVVVEYPALIAVPAFVLYAHQSSGSRRATLWLLTGLALNGAVLLLYHAVVFGSTLTLPYEYSTQSHRHLGLYMGITAVDPAVIYQLLFGSYRGLFYTSPWLLSALPGAAVFLSRKTLIAESLFALYLFICFLLLNASLVDWEGGWASGPRYLLPALPFLAFLSIGLFSRLGDEPAVTLRRPYMNLASLALFLVMTYSFAMNFVATAVDPQAPDTMLTPYSQRLFPAFLTGNLAINPHPLDSQELSSQNLLAERDITTSTAFNLGHLLGLVNAVTLLPLLLIWLVIGKWMKHLTRDEQATAPPVSSSSGC